MEFEKMNLTQEQQYYYDLFDKALNNGENFVVFSDRRGWGKTTIVNEIGFTYQALGYMVFLITQFPNSNEHFVTKVISSECDFDFRNLNYKKCVAIIDEYDPCTEQYINIIKRLNECNIPYVGFGD